MRIFPELKETMDAYGRAFVASLAMVAWAGTTLAAMLLLRRDAFIFAVALAALALAFALPQVRHFRRAFLLVVAATVLGVIGLEAGLRVRHFGVDALVHPTNYGPYSEILGTGIVRPVEDDTLVYGMPPRLRTYFMGRSLVTNAQGFRGVDFVEARTPGKKRILAVGTSITLGGGVDAQDAFPAALERVLTSRGEPTEVYNCGVPAYPAALRFNLAEQLAARYHPDAIVVELRSGSYYDSGDVTRLRHMFGKDAPPEPPISQIERYSFAASGLYPPTNLRQRVDALLARVGIHAAAAAPVAAPSGKPSMDYLKRRIGELVALGKKDGFRVYVAMLRPMHGFEDRSFEKKEREEMTAFAASVGAVAVDTYGLFDAGEFPDDFQVFPGDNHPNARAHHRFAVALAEAIKR